MLVSDPEIVPDDMALLDVEPQELALLRFQMGEWLNADLRKFFESTIQILKGVANRLLGDQIFCLIGVMPAKQVFLDRLQRGFEGSKNVLVRIAHQAIGKLGLGLGR